MPDSAKNRIKAVGQQLAPGDSLPAIAKVAGSSSGPRVQDKVIIITGEPRPLPPLRENLKLRGTKDWG